MFATCIKESLLLLWPLYFNWYKCILSAANINTDNVDSDSPSGGSSNDIRSSGNSSLNLSEHENRDDELDEHLIVVEKHDI